MAGGAVQRDAVEAQRSPQRGADWTVHAVIRLGDEAERFPAVAGQVVAAEFWQCPENADRDAGEPIAAGGPVFELHHRVFEMLRNVLVVVAVEDERADERPGRHDDHDQAECAQDAEAAAPHRASAIAAASSSTMSAAFSAAR
jgi:hypothetical protein